MTLTQMFDPTAVAIVGASTTEGKIGYEAMANAAEFDSPVYPVNPSSKGTLFGEAFVPSVTDIDDDVDLALCCVPGPVTPEVIEECGEAGVGAVVVYAGGFAEAGEDGERLQQSVVEVAEEYDISVLGPNTSGFVVPRTNLLCSFASGAEKLPAGNTAVVAQSGGVAHALAFQSRRQGRGVSVMVGLGNRANVGFTDVIEYFDGDEDTGAIVIHVEGTDDGRALLEACRESETPVIAYKVGQSDVGEFAESHTGALTGDHELYLAGFAQYGIPTVDATDDLLDAAAALADSPEPDGPNVGVVTAQAGPGIIITDRIQRAGGRLPELTAETRDRVDELLSGVTYTGNPVDTGRPMPAFGDVVTAVAEDDNVDIVLVYELFEQAMGFPADALDGLAERVDKPILFATDGIEEDMADDKATLTDAGVPMFETPERAGDAAAVLARYAKIQGRAGAALEASR
ncbi:MULTISPECIES: CoA-binding protein [Halorubrum]|uniref:acetate--CoA ligase (ADP-forming) n=1 Tax=Halorubrum tropicale TaxID=1765655 RepID=A0A0M9AN62_9EURY|nr:MULTISPECIES: CoA-binding protein [Halorubrum]KOX95447.1 CoA-binding protein [Halorubrum tropicale]MDB2249735.1 CoA-binding protein [Halorubrum ezzemoulense]